MSKSRVGNKLWTLCSCQNGWGPSRLTDPEWERGCPYRDHQQTALNDKATQIQWGEWTSNAKETWPFPSCSERFFSRHKRTLRSNVIHMVTPLNQESTWHNRCKANGRSSSGRARKIRTAVTCLRNTPGNFFVSPGYLMLCDMSLSRTGSWFNPLPKSITLPS